MAVPGEPLIVGDSPAAGIDELRDVSHYLSTL